MVSLTRNGALVTSRFFYWTINFALQTLCPCKTSANAWSRPCLNIHDTAIYVLSTKISRSVQRRCCPCRSSLPYRFVRSNAAFMLPNILSPVMMPHHYKNSPISNSAEQEVVEWVNVASCKITHKNKEYDETYLDYIT